MTRTTLSRALRAATVGGALAAGLLTLGLPGKAQAYWHGGWGGPGVYIGIAPPVVVAPPPVYAPPPVAYVPGPYAYYGPPGRVWIPGHWHNGYWVPPHWR